MDGLEPLDGLESIERLAGLARRCPPPPLAIEAGLWRKIRARQRGNLVALWSLAAGSAAAAAVLVALALGPWEELVGLNVWASPLTQFLTEL